MDIVESFAAAGFTETAEHEKHFAFFRGRLSCQTEIRNATGVLPRGMKRKHRKSHRDAVEAAPRSSRYLHYALVVLIILFFASIRFRLRDFPLERDEGEYAYMGQLLLQGIPPYSAAYNMKLPGTYAAYAALMAIFGQTPAGIHIGFLLVNAVTILLVYLLGKRVSGSFAGVIACAAYALLSASPSVLGISAHATHFVILPALAGVYLLLKAIDARRLRLFAVSGLFAGLAFLMKQPGIFFVLFGPAFLLYEEFRQKKRNWKAWASRTGLFLLGSAVPFGLICLLLYYAGVFERFWFWTFSYARAYGAQTSVSEGMKFFRYSFSEVVSANLFIWILAAAGLVLAFRSPGGKKNGTGLAVGLLFFSFLAVCPGLYFRPHYFVLMLPAVALLAAIAVDSARRFASVRSPSLHHGPALLFLVIFAYSLYQQGEYFFALGPAEANRVSYGNSPFLASAGIGRYIDSHARPDARIMVLGSEPQIYFYSRRRSATGYIYAYSMMEKQPYALAMQQEMIRETENAKPEYIVFVPDPVSWMKTPQSEVLLLGWADKYIAANYTLEGIADVRDTGEVSYRWGDSAGSYGPRTDSTIRIYRRND